MAGTQEPGKPDRHALIVAGPTCSGKSALAMDLARRFGGTVINADSMQIYRELRILTARPSPADEAAVPHALYGVRPAAQPGNAAWWRDAALTAMAAAQPAILCGGTGLYLRAITAGLADIPDPGAPARNEARGLLAELGAAALHAKLALHDPATAARLRPSDGQRTARAWEVWRGTGRGLSAWQADAPLPSGWRFAAVLLNPRRLELRSAVAQRFATMLQMGAVMEAAALLEQNLDPGLPAMRALGMPNLAAYLRAECSLAEAERRAVLATGQYTKRQATWFRHHNIADPSLTHTIDALYTGPEQLSESFMGWIGNFVHQGG